MSINNPNLIERLRSIEDRLERIENRLLSIENLLNRRPIGPPIPPFPERHPPGPGPKPEPFRF